MVRVTIDLEPGPGVNRLGIKEALCMDLEKYGDVTRVTVEGHEDYQYMLEINWPKELKPC